MYWTDVRAGVIAQLHAWRWRDIAVSQCAFATLILCLNRRINCVLVWVRRGSGQSRLHRSPSFPGWSILCELSDTSFPLSSLLLILFVWIEFAIIYRFITPPFVPDNRHSTMFYSVMLSMPNWFTELVFSHLFVNFLSPKNIALGNIGVLDISLFRGNWSREVEPQKSLQTWCRDALR